MKKDLADALTAATNAPGTGLAHAALVIARIEFPRLDPDPYLAKLDALGESARQVIVQHAPDGDTLCCIKAVNEHLFGELKFAGNRDKYEDPRNSCLNEVLDRRTGIPISLAVVYLEIARRAGLRVEGVNFPGHFLLRAADEPALPAGDFFIIDPFHGGALLSEIDCRELLRQHVGDEAAFDNSLLAPATRHDIVVRMLVNLKRLYVRMRSFPQARFMADLLLTVDPSAISELRDRGLLAYHLQDFAAALRDLEEYLRLAPKEPHDDEAAVATSADGDETEQDEHAENSQVWEHVKNLRKRVAGFN
jgi:regulator of sirC expression with transglutaminase-like and TPR domain